MEVLTTTEKTRRRELVLDTQAALKNGQSLEEFRIAHEQRVERWVQLFRAEMERWGSGDPLQVLPAVLAKVEESAIAAARARTSDLLVELMKTVLSTRSPGHQCQGIQLNP